MAASNNQVQNGDSTNLLLKSLEGSNTLPLWTQMTRLNPLEPNPTAIPFIWKYQSIRPTLLRAGELITEKQAERRVLMLINPARGTFAKGQLSMMLSILT